MYVWSRAARSHFLRVSCDTGREAGAEGRERLAILGKLLFNLAGSLVQVYTLDREKSFLSLCIPYHFKVLGGLINWSLLSPAVSELLVGQPSCRVMLSFSNFLQRHSSTGTLTDTLLV